MPSDITEADWKVFRSLRPIALDRFCEQVLAEIEKCASKSGKSAHERYLSVFKLLKRRDKELAQAFDEMRRSTANLQIALIRKRGLWTDEEFGRFSPVMREWVAGLSRL